MIRSMVDRDLLLPSAGSAPAASSPETPSPSTDEELPADLVALLPTDDPDTDLCPFCGDETPTGFCGCGGGLMESTR